MYANAEDRVQLAGRDHQHDADRRVPRRGPSRGDAPRRAHARHRRRRARHRSGRDPAQELHPGRRVPVHDGHRRDVRHRRVRQAARPRCSSTRATTSCAPSRPRAASATTRSCSASASRRTSRSPRRWSCTTEWGTVEIEDDGTVLAYVGTSAHGQGHETAFSHDRQRRARRADGRRPRRALRHRRDPARAGHRRARVRCRSAAARCRSRATRCSTQAKQLAAHLLEANPDDIVLGDGGLEVAGVPASTLSWAELARGREGPGAAARTSMDERLAARARLRRRAVRRSRSARTSRSSRSTATPAASSCCATSRSTTAAASSTRCSSRASSTAASRQGVAQVLYEDVQYDDDGNPITGEPHGLRDAVGRRAPVVRDVQHRDAEPAQPARREGHRRVGDDRFDARGAQRDRRRAVAPRCPPRRHAVHRRARVARAAGSDAVDGSSRQPTLRLTESQYRTIVGHCYDGLPERSVRIAARPGRRRRANRRACVTEARAVPRTPTRRR